jgi:hypothetical protein
VAGYIKDHRKELESDIWLMPPLYHRAWQWLKYNVNHSDNEIPMRDGSRMLIKRGQRLTSVRDIAKGISWYEGKKYKEPNPKTISAILDWMIKTNMILITRGQSNREYTLITLINYEVYNEKESQGNSKVTPDGEGREQLADINNNDKELLKNDKKKTLKDYTPEFDEFWNVYPRKISKSVAFTKWKKIIKTESFDFLMQCVSNYAKECEMKKTADEYIKHPSTFLEKERYKDYYLLVIGGGNSGKHGKGNERTLQANGYDKGELESLYVGSPVRVQQVSGYGNNQ